MAKRLNNITVKKHNSETVLIENLYAGAGGEWTFGMPASDADVYSTFAEASKIHRISVCEDYVHGTLNVNAGFAAEGSTITITATPDDGYRVNTVIVKDEDGIEIDTVGDGPYFFNMGTKNVTVCAIFVNESDRIATSESNCIMLSIDNGEHSGQLIVNKGDTVQVHPTDENTISSLSIVEENGSRHVQYTIGSDDVISFVMPDYDVKVSGGCTTDISGMHKLTVKNTTGGGTIEPSASYFRTGEQITISLYPDNDRVADTVLYKQGDDATAIGLTGSAVCWKERTGVFNGPDADILVYGSFGYCRPNQNEHNITVKAVGASGEVPSCSSANLSNITSWASKERAVRGEIIRIDWDSEVCCEFNGLTFTPTITESDILDNRTFLMPDNDITVNVQFKQSGAYKITEPEPLNNSCEQAGISITACKVSGSRCDNITYGTTEITCGSNVRLTITGMEESEDIYISELHVNGDDSGREIPTEIELPADNDESENVEQPITYTFVMPSEDVKITYCFANDAGGGGLAEDEYYIYLDVRPTPHSGNVNVPDKAIAGTFVAISFDLVERQYVKSLAVGAVNTGLERVCYSQEDCLQKLSDNYYVFTMPRGDTLVTVELAGGSKKTVSACDSLSTHFDNCDCKFISSDETLSNIGATVTEGSDTFIYLKKKDAENNQIILTAYYNTGSNIAYIPVTDNGPVGDKFASSLDNISCQSIDKSNDLPTFEEYTFLMPNKNVTVCPMVVPSGNKKIYRDYYYYIDENNNQIDAIYNVTVNGSVIQPSSSCAYYDVCYENISPGSEVTVNLKTGFTFTSNDELNPVWMLGDDGKKTNLVSLDTRTGNSCTFTMPITDAYIDFSIIEPGNQPSRCEIGYSLLKMTANKPEGINSITFSLNGSQVTSGCAPEDSEIRVTVDTTKQCNENEVPTGFIPKSPRLIDSQDGSELQVEITPRTNTQLRQYEYRFRMPTGKSCEFLIGSEAWSEINIVIDSYYCDTVIYKYEGGDWVETERVAHNGKSFILHRTDGETQKLRFEISNIDNCYKWDLVNGKRVLRLTDRKCGDIADFEYKNEGDYSDIVFEPGIYDVNITPLLTINNEFNIVVDQTDTAYHTTVNIENECYLYTERNAIEDERNYISFVVSPPNVNIHGYSGDNPYELSVRVSDGTTDYECESLSANSYRFYVDRPSSPINNHTVYVNVKYVCHAKVLELESHVIGSSSECNNLCVFTVGGETLSDNIRRKVFPESGELNVRMYTCNIFVSHTQHTALGTVYLQSVKGSPVDNDDSDKIIFKEYTSNKTPGEEGSTYIDVTIKLNDGSVDGVYTLDAEYLADSLSQLSMYISKSDALKHGKVQLLGSYQFDVRDYVSGTSSSLTADIAETTINNAYIAYHGIDSRDLCELNCPYILIPEGLNVKFSLCPDESMVQISQIGLYTRGAVDCYEEYANYHIENDKLVFAMPDEYVRMEVRGND